MESIDTGTSAEAERCNNVKNVVAIAKPKVRVGRPYGLITAVIAPCTTAVTAHTNTATRAARGVGTKNIPQIAVADRDGA